MEALRDAVALITGGAGGIGLAIGQALTEVGARVVLTDIDEVELAAAGKACPAAATFPLDVLDRRQWADVRDAIERDIGPIDVLCNNAGIGPDLSPLADMSPDNWDRIISMNLTSVFNGVSACASKMRERQRGHIVNTASMAGLTASARLGGYTAAKFGVVGMSEVLRAELASDNVGVSVLCPGMVTTRLGLTTERIGAGPPPSANRPVLASMDSIWVGRRTVEAIQRNDLYIVTHPARRATVKARVDGVIQAFDVEPAQPGFEE